MATITDIRSLEMGTDISFTTKHTADGNTYQGTLIGFGNYSVVRSLMDILPYYQGVKKAVPDLAPMTELEYFIIEYLQEDIVDGSKSTKTFVCAFDWVESSSVTVISLREHFDIRIYNRPASEAAKVVELLQSHGYTCNKLED